MAYLIECDRCGDTEKMATTSGAPYLWVHLADISRNGIEEVPPIKGGVFCPRCMTALADWRAPIPRCAPIDREQFKKRA